MPWEGFVNPNKIFTIIFIIFLFIISSTYYYLKLPVRMVEREFEGIRSFFPDVRMENFYKEGWKGKVFKNINFELRLLWKKMEREKGYSLMKGRFKESYRGFYFIAFGDTGIYVLWKRDKGYAIASVFYYKDRVYWIDIYSNQPFKKYKDVIDHLIKNMEIDGERFSGDLDGLLRNMRIPQSIIMRDEIFILILSGIFLYVFIILKLLFSFGFKRPKDLGMTIIEEKTIVSIKAGISRKNYPALVCIKDGKIIGFSGGKKIFEKDITSDIKMEGNKVSFSLNNAQYSFTVSETERWRIYI